MTRICILDDDLYPREALHVAEREFSSLCVVQCRRAESGTEITIEPRPEAPEETTDEFLNFLLCAALVQRLNG